MRKGKEVWNNAKYFRGEQRPHGCDGVLRHQWGRQAGAAGGAVAMWARWPTTRRTATCSGRTSPTTRSRSRRVTFWRVEDAAGGDEWPHVCAHGPRPPGAPRRPRPRPAGAAWRAGRRSASGPSRSPFRSAGHRIRSRSAEVSARSSTGSITAGRLLETWPAHPLNGNPELRARRLVWHGQADVLLVPVQAGAGRQRHAVLQGRGVPHVRLRPHRRGPGDYARSPAALDRRDADAARLRLCQRRAACRSCDADYRKTIANHTHY